MSNLRRAANAEGWAEWSQPGLVLFQEQAPDIFFYPAWVWHGSAIAMGPSSGCSRYLEKMPVQQRQGWSAGKKKRGELSQALLISMRGGVRRYRVVHMGSRIIAGSLTFLARLRNSIP